MDLEIVEVIMRIEEDFDITVPDEDAERLITVGSIYEYVLQALDVKHENRLREGWSDAEVWETVRALIAEEASVALERVVPEAELVRDLDMG